MAVSSASRAAPAVRLAAWPQQVPTWLVVLLLGGVALVPRALGLNDFYTIDEAYHWPARTRAFADAILAHDWARTNQTGHPGVTTMWLGSLGYWLAGWMQIAPPARTGDGTLFLALLRLPLAIANSLAVLGGYALLRRLFAPATAMLAALLWATAPFLVAHSRVLHLDALLTTCMSLSLLCLLVATAPPTDSAEHAPAQNERVTFLSAHPATFFGSAVFAGLALLTKAPALILLPFTGLWMLCAGRSASPIERLRRTIISYALWLGIALLVVFAGWPALWVAPREAIASVVEEIVSNGGQPHVYGNFFLGQPIDAPGWTFYPLVVAWRMTPLALLGIILAPLAIAMRRGERRALLGLLLFALFFLLVMGSEPKEFDRYILPIWPALLVLAAAGLAAPFQLLARRFGSALRLRTFAAAALAAGLCGALLAEVMSYHPYTLAYFNPLLGGGPVAARTLLVGWGEGAEQASAWLRDRPDLDAGAVVARNPPTYEPFLPVRVGDLTAKNLTKNPNYVVLYVSYLQRQTDPDLNAQVQQNPPLHTVMINGIPYAAIYQMPRPFDTAVDATFEGSIHLRGTTVTRDNNILTITPSWDIRQDEARQLFVFVHLLDANGQHVAQLDLPLDPRFPQLQAGQQLASPIALPLPQGLAPGSYRVALGVYTIQDGARLPITQGAALPEATDGPHVADAGTITIPMQ